MRRIRKSHVLGAVALAAIVTAFAVPAATVHASAKGSGLPTKIGKGEGRRFTIRPEKILMTTDGAGEGESGTVREVVYLGMVTRFVVDLDAGGELAVVRQNLETSSQEALAERGKRVRLSWRPEHTYEITKEGT